MRDGVFGSINCHIELEKSLNLSLFWEEVRGSLLLVMKLSVAGEVKITTAQEIPIDLMRIRISSVHLTGTF